MENMLVDVTSAESKEHILNEAMNEYGQDLLQLVYSYVNHTSVAEDLTQDIFVKCYNALHTYNGKSKFKTWLWRIAINHCKDFLKSWYNNKVITTDEESSFHRTEVDVVEHEVIQKEDDENLIHAIMQLEIKYREVIYLFYYEELSIKEIALVTEVSDNTVKTRMRRAKELLKIRLEG
ncbi:sigma-70 family RNA polymerase sigma factor [Fictibacillus norfolkensis]|uniref:Sigma-70 family RNA polymerase sigma factor n=1 Tax=Fictibacillus norfolkensis TaxID=2762233 RepID=A0ABR8SJD8_9BACL|nr:sigma-70 family RNA polymerase sigma factor [Fictibacillus norfolkensis]MBD7963602.1 sigma-70 family RNA polymerase sigma factor [Fictibacillus norfolkensis]